jgi:hypothetical protein
MVESKRDNQHLWSRMVASLALARVPRYEDLNRPLSGNELDPRIKFLFTDYDPRYSQALLYVVDESQRLAPKTLSQRLVSQAFKLGGFDQKLVAEGIKMTVNSSKHSPVLELVSRSIDNLPSAIDKWIKEGSVDPMYVSDLAEVSDGLRSGDQFLKTKIIVDAVQAELTRLNIDLRTQKEFVRKLIINLYPAFQYIKPESISIAALEVLQNYGLDQYLPVHMYLISTGSPGKYGKMYERKSIDRSEAKPKPDQVSTRSYADRINEWNREVANYTIDRSSAIALLNEYSSHYTDEGLNRGYDINWVRRNFSKIRQEVISVIDRESMKKILEFCKKPKLESYDRTNIAGEGNFEAVFDAIKMAFEFAEFNHTAMSDRFLGSALLSFRDNLLGLYHIEESKK